MCEKGQCCQKPEELKSEPGKCTPEQIKKCHGDDKGHPCHTQKSSTEGDK
ncbi:hypothetical protein Pcar_2840 [Syntrophotalea carbinolica DSM 2380]|uniref:Uncharacterized protein n=1 Tax=Syntrophotalea carbinolica (strain DSM 2380 / NBRC 103641 / GraBd1) TaxID=338963 RepID=Q3A0N2_SYNC1|nr:hypothetical protein [Syntrophotalea carbinolica]ABA90075.1 hypothetical protein Pcar_2840 [Syntrophotalea carbinolica DSM 2380]